MSGIVSVTADDGLQRRYPAATGWAVDAGILYVLSGPVGPDTVEAAFAPGTWHHVERFREPAFPGGTPLDSRTWSVEG